MPADIVIAADHLSKCYNIYDKPQDRLKQAIVPRLQRLVGRPQTPYARVFWALRDVSFEVDRGETLGVIGRNGSGKSTLLQMLCGTLTPASGTVQVRGRIAAMLELGSGFNPEFTGRENVYMNGAVLGLSQEEIAARYDAITRFAGIGAFVDQPVKTYSSGMVVRLAFAVSVCVEPDVLVVDEALAVGDMAFQQQCLQRLRDLREAGTTIVLVTHDIMLTRNYCSRVIYLQDGALRAIGDAETVGEMYVKDTLASQEGPTASPAAAIEWKDDGGRLRFGSSRGAITNSRVAGSRSVGPIFEQGEVLTVHVEARVAADVRNPELVVQLRDARGYVLYGIPTRATDVRVRPDDEGATVSAAIDLAASLGPGEYSFSLGLVERDGHRVATVLDKIVGAIPFMVGEAPDTPFHGPVNLHGRWHGTG
jgi:lipopolysaccharide transport system ATP-binding protein